MVNRRWLSLFLIAALSLPIYADRGKDAYKRGAQAEREANYDSAFAYYKQAHEAAPNNAAYFTAFTRMRFNVALQHVRNGQLLRNTGALPQALAEFQRAVEVDTSNFAAQQELRRTADMLRQQEKQRSLPRIEPAIRKMPPEVEESVELQPLSAAPITLHLTVNADVAYKTIEKLAGLNVLIDPDYRPQKITLDLSDVTLREALDMVRLQSKTYWRPVLANTIFVTVDSAAKRKEMEQNVMKTFYLSNITTPNDLQEAATMVRQILDISRVQLLQAQDAIIVRGTPDQMILAEKLLTDYDKPKAEVVIDIAVMQVSRDRIRNIGTNVPTSASIGYVGGSGGANNAGSGSSTTGSSGGGATWRLGNFAISVPGTSFTFLATDSNTKLLQNPEIRVLNNEKATLRIGDRVPIATGSFQPGIVGGAGVSPLISTQFQYVDVGVNVDITPHIHSNREVTLKMMLEISSVTGSESIGGITQPIIGQRRIDHETRLADGDVNLLGGILEDSETQSLSGYPWLSKLPILKYFFAQENRDRRENEIIFAITPHILRAREVDDENRRTVEVGTGSSIELRRKQSAPAAKPERPADAAQQQQPAAQARPSGTLVTSGAPAQGTVQTKPAGSR
jgi:general secretion pathway protein D